MPRTDSKKTEKHKGPLVGLRVLVTRAQGESAESLSLLLEEAGAQPIEIPVIHFGDPNSFDELDNSLSELGSYDWIIFASSNAVNSVMARAKKAGILIQEFPELKIGAIGQSTADKLTDSGLTVDFVPSSFVAESFVGEFPAAALSENPKILWPRTNIGRTLIADALRAKGATVDTVEAYQTCLPPDAAKVGCQLIEKFKKGEIDVVTLASAQTVKNLAEILELGWKSMDSASSGSHTSLESLLTSVKIATIGPVTTNSAKQLLKVPDIQASVFTAEGLIDALKKYFVPL